MDEVLVMVFKGDLVDYMVQVNPKRYGPHVHVTKTGKTLLYIRSVKALFGCICSMMLQWKLLTSTLLEEGFEVNPYDPCVANKVISDDDQCTICWYVDDLKISDVDKAFVRQVITGVEDRYDKMF